MTIASALGRLDPRRMTVSGLVLSIMATQIVMWTLAPSLTHTAPPLDVVESALWGREGVLLSYKHPDLPGLLIEAVHRATGVYGWPNYLLSQVFVAATYWLVYRLGADLIGPVLGAAGALLLTGCYYFSWPTPEFNHNVAQMPFWAAIAFCLWRAVANNSWRLWVVLGLVAGVGMYAKFSTALLLVAAAAWLLVDRRGRACLATPRPWVGLAAFLVTIAPLAVLLNRLDFLPLNYFESRATDIHSTVLPFLGAQLADVFDVIAFAAFALFWPRSRASAAVAAAPASSSLEPRRVVAFLLFLGLAPILLTAILAGAVGAKATWTAPMFNLVGLLLLFPLRQRVDRLTLQRVAGFAFAACLIAPIANAGWLIADRYVGTQPIRMVWPQAEIATRMRGVWRHATNAPLLIVGGDDWVAGLVALDAPERPSIYDPDDPRATPWITPARLDAEGALLVWPVVNGHRDHDGRDLPSATIHGVETFAWSPVATKVPITIEYAIIPPAE
jgi:4-amino-4-deoxy-L-arabinose transferase-like glycosyltransferase